MARDKEEGRLGHAVMFSLEGRLTNEDSDGSRHGNKEREGEGGGGGGGRGGVGHDVIFSLANRKIYQQTERWHQTRGREELDML